MAVSAALALGACGLGTSGSRSNPVESASDDDAVAAASCLPDCHGADLRFVEFREVDLDDANFSEADLRGARFEDVRATGVDFGRADLTGAEFVDVDFSGDDCVNRAGDADGPPEWVCDGAVSFRGDGQTPFMTGTTFERAVLVGADFTDARLEGVRILDSDLSKSTFSGAAVFSSDRSTVNVLDGSSFQEAVIGSLGAASLNATDFTRAFMSSGTISDATGTGTLFDGAVIDSSFLTRLTLTDPQFRGTRFRGVTQARGSTFTRADFTGATVQVLADGIVEDPTCPDGTEANGSGDFAAMCP